MRRRATIAVIAGLAAVLAGCQDGDPAAQSPAGSQLGFEVLASGADLAGGPGAAMVIDAGTVATAWRDLADASAPQVPDGSVAVIVSAGTDYRSTEVVAVVDDGGAWTVLLEGNDLAECAAADVVLSEVHLIAVDAAEPPSGIAQEVRVLPGCDL